MLVLRRRLSFLVAVWLAGQLVSTLIGPGSLVVGASAAELCTCPGGSAAATCPMHREHHQRSPDSGCTIGASSPAAVGALMSWLGGIGVMPAARTAAPVASVVRAPASSVVSLPSMSIVPDAPPPRA